MIGTLPCDKSFQFPENRTIRKVMIKTRGTHGWIFGLVFIDEENQEILRIETVDDYGSWEEFTLGQGHEIVGFNVASDKMFLLGVAFQTMKVRLN